VSGTIHKQFGDNLEFKHPVCSDCKGNVFTVEISERDDILLHCVKCLNIIDFQIINRKQCCQYPDYCGGECTCKICAPDLHIERLESELEECRCIKSSYFDFTLKCQQQFELLESRVRELEAERDRLKSTLARLMEAASKLLNRIDKLPPLVAIEGVLRSDYNKVKSVLKEAGRE
jgi:hypothetical protein